MENLWQSFAPSILPSSSRAVGASPHNHCTILYQRDINFLRYYDKGVVRYRMMRVSVLALSPDH